MAVSSTPESKQNQSKHKDKLKLKTSSKKEMKSPSAKRNNCPGVRVIGGRIYDSENGKCCHQCRQKTMDITAECVKTLKNNKTCSVRFCHKCLWNRYGENVEEVTKAGNWNCPKCRGICNCSFCMKKRGQQPTGQLVSTAKASGFSSVSELLQVNGPEKVASEKEAKKLTSPRKPGKENLFDGKVNTNIQTKDGVQKKSKKVKREENKSNGNEHSDEKKPKKPKVNVSQKKQKSAVPSNDSVLIVESPSNGNTNEKKTKKPKVNGSQKKNKEQPDEEKPKKTKVQKKHKAVKIDMVKSSSKNEKKPKKVKVNGVQNKLEKPIIKEINLNKPEKSEIPLPQKTDLTNLIGIDIPTEDIGNALQFLEFCTVFGKVLDIKKGQAEAVLKDIIHGRVSRRGKYSATVQFLNHLLSFIQKEQEEEESPIFSSGKKTWIHGLKDCLSKSKNVVKAMGLDIMNNGDEQFELLTSSKRLSLVNFMCDEVLGTDKVRDYMEEQNAKYSEGVKETREKMQAANTKRKILKKKMQDDIAKAIIAKKGSPLTILEHEAIVSQIKEETAEAEAEMLESQGLLSKTPRRCDAVRIEPIFLEINGCVYWRLNCYKDKSETLLQDVGNGKTLVLDEKWSCFGVDQKEAIEKHITSLRRKRVKVQKPSMIVRRDVKVNSVVT